MVDKGLAWTDRRLCLMHRTTLFSARLRLREVLFLGVVSCSMLVGDGVITPPNSVLGALRLARIQL